MDNFEVVNFEKNKIQKYKPKEESGFELFISNIRRRYENHKTDDSMGDKLNLSVLECISKNLFDYIENNDIKHTVISDSFYNMSVNNSFYKVEFVKIKLLFNLNYRFYGNSISDFFIKDQHHILYSAYYETIHGERFFALKHDMCPLSLGNIKITEADRTKYQKTDYLKELNQ